MEYSWERFYWKGGSIRENTVYLYFPACDVSSFSYAHHLTPSHFISLQVFKFFQDRIEMQYPLDAEGEEDIYQKRHEGHESFMKAKADAVLGRGELLDKVGRSNVLSRYFDHFEL